MKKCKFCDSLVENSKKECPSCGGNMFKYVCPNCGKEFDEGMFCPGCGVKVGQEEKICPKCGNHYFTNACSNCGYKPYTDTPVPTIPMITNMFPQQTVTPTVVPKKKSVALLLCLFLGFYGAHKFYLGSIAMGIIYLLTGGLFLIGWIIDFIVLAFTPSKKFITGQVR